MLFWFLELYWFQKGAIEVDYILGGQEKINLPLKSPRNNIIQILFQQC